MLEWSKAEKLNQALSLVLAIFHMDLEHLTHSLLLTLMPRLLLSTIHTHVLIDPHGFILAKLCVLCITGTQTSKIGQKGGFLLGLSVGGWLLGLSACGWLAAWSAFCSLSERWVAAWSVSGWLLGQLSVLCQKGGFCPLSERCVAAQSVCPSSERWVAVQSVCVSVLCQKGGWLIGLSVCLSFVLSLIHI